MANILVIVVIALCSFQTLFCKMFTDRYEGKRELASVVFCALDGGFICLFTWAWHGFRFQADTVTIALGILNAVIIWGYNTFLIKAGEKGSYAFLNVMMLFGGIVIPILYNTLVLGNALAIYQIGAIVLMLIACLLMNLQEISLKGTALIYYCFCGLLFLFNGIYGTILKIQADYSQAQFGEMIMITFGLMGCMALGQIWWKERKNMVFVFKTSGISWILLLICLLCAALAINATVLIIPLINVSVYYTIVNGGVLILSALYSVFLFHEKPTLVSMVGIALAITSITILSV